MPKKTHKQKVIAQYRRQISYLKQRQEKQLVNIEKQTNAVQKNPVVPTVQEPKIASNWAASTLIDLKKTLIISTLLFTLEILIFYAILKGIILGKI